MPPATWRSVPHNYMLGAFVYGGIAGETAAGYCAEVDLPAYDAGGRRGRAAARAARRCGATDGLPPHQIEYKLRRLVNDYLQPPKVTAQDARSAWSGFAEHPRGPGRAGGAAIRTS